MMNKPEQSRISPNNDEQEGDVVESPGCDGVGVVGYVSGVVMAWGYGRDGDHIPFLADGNYGVMGRGACDGISLKS